MPISSGGSRTGTILITAGDVACAVNTAAFDAPALEPVADVLLWAASPFRSGTRRTCASWSFPGECAGWEFDGEQPALTFEAALAGAVEGFGTIVATSVTVTGSPAIGATGISHVACRVIKL